MIQEKLKGGPTTRGCVPQAQDASSSAFDETNTSL